MLLTPHSTLSYTAVSETAGGAPIADEPKVRKVIKLKKYPEFYALTDAERALMFVTDLNLVEALRNRATYGFMKGLFENALSHDDDDDDDDDGEVSALTDGVGSMGIAAPPVPPSDHVRVTSREEADNDGEPVTLYLVVREEPGKPTVLREIDTARTQLAGVAKMIARIAPSYAFKNIWSVAHMWHWSYHGKWRCKQSYIFPYKNATSKNSRWFALGAPRETINHEHRYVLVIDSHLTFPWDTLFVKE